MRVMRRHLLTSFGALLFLTSASPALAQYKNTSFGFDVGAWLLDKGNLTNSNLIDQNGVLVDRVSRPIRLDHGFSIGGEINYKLEDHWWITGSLHLGFFNLGNGGTCAYDDSIADENTRQQAFDTCIAAEIGTVVGINGGLGIRYFFLTDQVRPYVQLAASYLHLVSTRATANDICSPEGVDLCGQDLTYYDIFMPQRHVGVIHFRPGIELIVKRDIALHFFADLQYWVVINTNGNLSMIAGAGVNFYGG